MKLMKSVAPLGLIGTLLVTSLLFPSAAALARTHFFFGLGVGVPLGPYPVYPYPYLYPYPYGYPYAYPYPPPVYHPYGTAYPRCVRVWVPGYYDAYGNWVFGYYRYECW